MERESRKVVTVLFCDLVGSTSLGESTDPEALRARMRRYFEDLRAIIERHGGTVEKFVGDAVMAVFGIPVAHEDDALRAVRAAWEMREAVATHGLEARIGVNTGEVFVGGGGETLVTGDAVNVAARLEQAAAGGEILIGGETQLLVRDAVRVEPVEPLELKGKSQAVPASRLLEVLAGAEPVARHLERPLVGRERERRRLRRDYEDAVADRACRLFTLLGPAGIGKSRLVADFLEHVSEDADVLRGRCLHYGEGITYWPLVEILIAAGIDADTVLGTSAAETQLTFRRLLEQRAAERPQVVVLDDLQWAEPTFLDLVEHVAELSRAAPIFLLCVARTELLDVRPGWGGGKLNATSLLLEPLGESECAELIERLVADGALDAELRTRIGSASGGNPLYMEEMLAMVREHGGGEIVVPPTIHALLQARLDTLDGDVRVVMERGSVEGEVFHRGSVAELAPPPVQPAVESHLATLVRKELIRADSPVFPDDEAFRFRHLLIRDAAYESLPKATRAQLHEQFAGWLDKHELVEKDEILGYHLEQAYRYRRELDPEDETILELAGRASTHLAKAGSSALDHGDFRGARTLLGRATDVLPSGDERRLAFASELARALVETGDVRFLAVLTEARCSAELLTRARASVTLAAYAFAGEAELTAAERQHLREDARVSFEAAADDVGMAMYWWAVSQEAGYRCRGAEAVRACENALAHLERAERPQKSLVLHLRGRLHSGYAFSEIPVDVGLDRLAELPDGEAGPLLDAHAQGTRAVLLSMRGEHERARQLVNSAYEVFASAGQLVITGNAAATVARVEIRVGDVARAERALRDGLDILEALGDRQFYPTLAAELALVLYDQGNHGEAREWHDRARATSGADDLVNFLFIDFVEVGMLARDGRYAEAEELGLHTIERADTTDYYWPRTCSRSYLAEALALAGRREEARAYGLAALEVTEAKGDVSLARRVREQLAAVGVEV